MKITVKLFTTLKKYLGEAGSGTGTLDLREGMKIFQLLDQLKIPKDIPKIVLVNSQQKTLEEPLKEGDTVSVFPPIAGG
ncbi:MAG: MoaD/ThiS family protein [Pseudomonadota bacterium]